VPKEKVGQAHFLSKQIYDTFPTPRKQVSRPIDSFGIKSPIDSSIARETIRLTGSTSFLSRSNEGRKLHLV